MQPKIILNDVLAEDILPQIIDKIKKDLKVQFKQRQPNFADLIDENTNTVALRSRTRPQSVRPNYAESRTRPPTVKKKKQ